jgi:hypothetical protein
VMLEEAANVRLWLCDEDCGHAGDANQTET